MDHRMWSIVNNERSVPNVTIVCQWLDRCDYSSTVPIMSVHDIKSPKFTLVDLIQQAQDGSRDAFGELYIMYRKPIYQVCLQRLLNKDDAEELMQEVFAEAFQNLETLKDGGAFFQWLCKIASNMSIDRVRFNSRHPMKQIENFDYLPADGDSPVDVALRSERSNLILLGFSRLRDSDTVNGHRRTIELRTRIANLLEERYFFEKSERELQDAHPTLPPGTIKQNLSRGRASLGHILEELGLGPEDSYL